MDPAVSSLSRLSGLPVQQNACPLPVHRAEEALVLRKRHLNHAMEDDINPPAHGADNRGVSNFTLNCMRADEIGCMKVEILDVMAGNE